MTAGEIILVLQIVSVVALIIGLVFLMRAKRYLMKNWTIEKTKLKIDITRCAL